MAVNLEAIQMENTSPPKKNEALKEKYKSYIKGNEFLAIWPEKQQQPEGLQQEKEERQLQEQH